MEDGRIAADKTTVTVYPQDHQIEIVQEELFAVIRSQKDSALVLEQWDKLFYWKERSINVLPLRTHPFRGAAYQSNYLLVMQGLVRVSPVPDVQQRAIHSSG